MLAGPGTAAALLRLAGAAEAAAAGLSAPLLFVGGGGAEAAVAALPASLLLEGGGVAESTAALSGAHSRSRASMV